MRSATIAFVAFAAAGCSAPKNDSTDTTSASELTTEVLASNVIALREGPNGELRVTFADPRAQVQIVNPASGALTPGSADPQYPGFAHAQAIGWDATHFYFYAKISATSHERDIYRVGLDAAAKPEMIGDVGNGDQVGDPLSTVVGVGVGVGTDAVYWTTLPNSCTVAAPPSCWEIALGRASAGAPAQHVRPQLADGTYVRLSQLAFYQGDLYGANSKGVYKVPGGDLGKPLEQVCAFPATFPTKLTSDSVFLGGNSPPDLTPSAAGFFLPLQSTNYEAALGLVKWDCSTQTVTPFGTPAQGFIKSFGYTQIAEIFVRGNTIFWLDRQPHSPVDQYAEDYFALKKTTL
jgi:hypothetical protein